MFIPPATGAFGFAVLFASCALAVPYTMKSDFEGPGFFSGFDFYEGQDVNTTGNVHYLSESDATAQRLAYVTDRNTVILKVDNVTVGQPTDMTFGRNSVRIQSKEPITSGTLVLFDALHMPYGCSVWPGYWTNDETKEWPQGGEIDIVEGVNLQSQNAYALHTTQGCTHPPTATGETGALMQSDCYNNTNYNTGCKVGENTPNSYGVGFKYGGGGMYALLWDEAGMKIWFFPRGYLSQNMTIPLNVQSSAPDPALWSTPSAFYPNTTCDFGRYFGPQTIILDITICGNFAGEPSIFNGGGCPGLCTDLVRTPTNYDTAYFEIKSLKIFTDHPATNITPPTPTSSIPGYTQSIIPPETSAIIIGASSARVNKDVGAGIAVGLALVIVGLSMSVELIGML